MPVYMIRAGQHGPVKIGFSDNVSHRFSDLQVGNHERLSLLRMFHGDRAAEAQLHVEFEDLRLHGDWFSFSKRLLGNVGLEEIVVPTETKRKAARRQEVVATSDHEDGRFVAAFDELTEIWAERRGGEGRIAPPIE